MTLRKKIAQKKWLFWETKHYSKLTTSLLNISVCIPINVHWWNSCNCAKTSITAVQLEICEMLVNSKYNLRRTENATEPGTFTAAHIVRAVRKFLWNPSVRG